MPYTFAIARSDKLRLGPGSLEQIDFEAIEVAACRVALDLMARTVQRHFDQDHSDRDGASLPVSLRPDSALPGPPAQDVHPQRGPDYAPARLFPLLPLPQGLLSPRSGPAPGRPVPVTSRHAHDRVHRRPGQFRRCQCLVGRTGRPPCPRQAGRTHGRDLFWTAEARHPKTQRPMRDPGAVRYLAAIESAAMRDTDALATPFVQRVQRLTVRCSYAEGPRQVVLA